MPINIDKIKKELDKGTTSDQYEALEEITKHVATNLAKEREQHDNLSNDLKSKIEKINGK